VEQPGKSILSKYSGEGKQNFLSHLPLLEGNISAYDIFGNNKPIFLIFLPKYSNSSMEYYTWKKTFDKNGLARLFHSALHLFLFAPQSAAIMWSQGHRPLVIIIHFTNTI